MIKHLIRQLTEPSDYFDGAAKQPPPLPQNILCFQRQLLTSQHLNEIQHHRFVLITPIETAGLVVIDEQIRQHQPGQAHLVFPFQLHSFLTVDQPILWLFVTFEMQSSTHLTHLRNRCLQLPHNGQELVENLLRAFLTPDTTCQDEMPYWLSLLLHGLKPDQIDTSPPPELHHKLSLPLIEKVNRYIYAHLAHPFQINDVAKACSISESHLRSIFRQCMGTSLGQYINRVRLHRACALLKTTSLQVGEVGAACGFQSLAVFSRAFRHTIGTSPKTYRTTPTTSQQ